MRERNAGIGRTAGRRGDPRHHGKIDMRPSERLELFAAAAEDERVATLQTDDSAPSLSVFDQQIVNSRLLRARASRRLAHADQRRVAPREIEYGVRHQTVVQDDIRVLKRTQGLQGEQFGIAGTCAHQGHAAGRTRRGGGRRQQLPGDAQCPAPVPLDEAARGGTVDDGLEIAPPLARAAQPPAARLAQLAQPQRQVAETIRNECLQAFAQATCQDGRGAAGGNRHQHGIAIDDGRHDESRRFAIVHDVHGDGARVGQFRDPPVQRALRRGDDHEVSALQVVRNEFAKCELQRCRLRRAPSARERFAVQPA